MLLATGAANRASLTTGIAATTGVAANKTGEGADEEEHEIVGKMSDGA